MKNKEQGITLIALAITIIVLLILAGLSISSLLSDNGILKQSQTAAEQNKIQEYKQELTLKLLEAQLQTMETKLPADEGYVDSLRTNVMAKIDGGVYNKEEKTGDTLCTATTKTGGYKYTITATEVIYGDIGESGSEGDGEEGSAGTWTQNGVQVTNGKVTLEVGSAVSGYSANNVSNWYVLGAQNGRLLITTNTNVAQVQLSGQTGYTGGIAKLNTEAAKYTNSQYAEGSARSINVNDINRVTGYNIDTNFNEGNINQWGNEVVYTNKDNVIYYKKGENGIYPVNETSSEYTSFTYWTGTEWKTLDNKESSTQIQNTFYYYFPQTQNTTSSSSTSINGSSNAYRLLFTDTSSIDKYYWLASMYIQTKEGVVNYCMRNVMWGYVRGNGVYNSDRYWSRW